jgi:hypothetical protein
VFPGRRPPRPVSPVVPFSCGVVCVLGVGPLAPASGPSRPLRLRSLPCPRWWALFSLLLPLGVTPPVGARKGGDKERPERRRLPAAPQGPIGQTAVTPEGPTDHAAILVDFKFDLDGCRSLLDFGRIVAGLPRR